MRSFLIAALLLAAGSAAVAASAKQTTLSGKVGKSNVQVRIVLHPQVDGCSAAAGKAIRTQALRLGLAHVRANLAKLVKGAGTDASGAGEFFGVSYLAGCPKDAPPWIAFPAEGKEKSVTRYDARLGWSPMVRL